LTKEKVFQSWRDISLKPNFFTVLLKLSNIFDLPENLPGKNLLFLLAFEIAY
jgi:hypothetical protein